MFGKTLVRSCEKQRIRRTVKVTFYVFLNYSKQKFWMTSISKTKFVQVEYLLWEAALLLNDLPQLLHSSGSGDRTC